MDQSTLQAFPIQANSQQVVVLNNQGQDSPRKKIKIGKQSYERISQKKQTYFENILEQKAYIEIDVTLQRKIQKIIEIHETKQKLHSEEKQMNVKVCRICYSETNSPLISPCKCKGSMRDVHQECLKMWIIEKIKQNQQDFQNSSCEVCGEKYKMELTHKTKFLPQMLLQQKLSSLLGESCIMLILFSLIITSSLLIDYLVKNGLQLAYLFLTCFCCVFTLIFFYLVTMIIFEVMFVQIIEKWTILDTVDDTICLDISIPNLNNNSTIEFRSNSTPIIKYKTNFDTTMEFIQVL